MSHLNPETFRNEANLDHGPLALNSLGLEFGVNLRRSLETTAR